MRVTIVAYPGEGGSRLVIGGDKQKDISQAIDWARKLPEPGEGGASPASPEQQASEQQGIDPPETPSPTVAPDIPRL